MPKVMTREEREAFLAGVHVGAISVASGDDRGPLVTPVWYSYEPGGDVMFMTGPETRKAQLMQVTGRATLLVQDEGAPYRYLSVEGPVKPGTVPDPEWRRALHHHYLGPEQGDLVYEATKDVLGDEIVYHLQPQRWNSSDYSAEFGSG
jgi:nitroimidazol reductase NimA-like FMN-containing flavoprotein (pyridoxamine 5'-phosphate oxidase superfamily)